MYKPHQQCRGQCLAKMQKICMFRGLLDRRLLLQHHYRSVLRGASVLSFGDLLLRRCHERILALLHCDSGPTFARLGVQEKQG